MVSILRFSISNPWWRTWWFLLMTLISIASVVIFFYRLRLQQVRSKTQHQHELAQLELTALRAQMNPHFIFNSLNSIKRLIQREDKEEAIEYLTKFSMMIRQILASSDNKLVSITEEIGFCRRYLEMENLRFQNKFDYFINIDPTIDMEIDFIPPLFLQPYLENAIWHGILNSEKKGILELNISKCNNCIKIEIEDNGVGRAMATKMKKDNLLKKKSRGMMISKKRSELAAVLYGQEIEIEIVDKEEQGKPSGTKIVIVIQEQGNT